MRNNIWLTVDWDFFCPEPLAWAHAETHTYYGTVWEVRLALARAKGYDIEAATALCDPHPDIFWNKLRHLGYRFENLKAVVVGDSHQFGYDVFSRSKSEGPSLSDTRLVNFDAHHDMTYNMAQFEQDALRGRVTCENWMLMTHLAQIQLQSTIVFPPWKGMADWDRSFGGDRFPELQESLRRYTTPCVWSDPQVAESAGAVELVYICRSSAWSPPWHDAAFIKFVNRLATMAKVPVVAPFKEAIDPLAQRVLNYKQVDELAALSDIDQIAHQLENPRTWPSLLSLNSYA